jgi:hypothetical protein
MASIEEKGNFVLWLAELKSMPAARLKFRACYSNEVMHRNLVRNWAQKFKETGDCGICQASFLRSPQKSMKWASMELDVPNQQCSKF